MMKYDPSLIEKTTEATEAKEVGTVVADRVAEARAQRSELAKRDTAETALAKVVVPASGMVGEEDGDSRPPECRLVQAQTASEHTDGSLVNTLTDELIVEAPAPFEKYCLPKLLPLHIRSTYRAWSDTTGPPLYAYKSLKWVEEHHPEHLEDGSDADGVGPRARRVISLFALLENRDEPIVINFEKSAIHCAVIISEMEKVRARRNQNAGSYLLGVEHKSWEKYSWYGWTRPVVQDAPESELERALRWIARIQEVAQREDRIEPDTDDKVVAEGDEVPF